MSVVILDVTEDFQAVEAYTNCRCVGFLEFTEPKEFEIVDENNRRIYSV